VRAGSSDCELHDPGAPGRIGRLHREPPGGTGDHGYREPVAHAGPPLDGTGVRPLATTSSLETSPRLGRTRKTRHRFVRRKYPL